MCVDNEAKCGELMLATPRVRTVAQSQIEPGYIPAPPPISCVPLSKLLNLSELPFPHLKKEYIKLAHKALVRFK